MTVSSTTKRNSYTGDGSTTTFAYSFKIFDDDDITVILRTTATGTETVQTKTTHYSVTGVGSTSGGNVVFGSAPTSAQTVVLLRQTAQTQATDYTPNDPFPAASHEDALDKLTLMAQDQQDELDRTIKLSRTNTMTSTEFTVGATDRANKVLGFDGSGELTVTQELGTFRGDFAASTSYSARDIIRDTSTGNIFIVNEAHTSSGSEPLTSNANSAKYTLLIESATAGVVAGTVTASRGVIVDSNKDITGFRNITLSGELTLGSGAVINEAELEAIDGVTAGTVAASKAVIVDSNKDAASFRNITLTGELDAGSLDVSGDADIDGTLEADAMTLNGTAITATATLDTGISNNNVPKFTSGVADNDFLRVDGTAIEGRSASEVLSDIAAAPAAGSSNIVTTGALNSGSITSGFGAIDNGSSNITTTGVGSFGSLDISGDIDVDGTTNLDVVDIDGAVDMASTLQVDGAITSSAGATFTTADNSTQLTLISTDADASNGPRLDLKRDSGSPADGDNLGRIRYMFDNDAAEQTEGVRLDAVLDDASDGTEDVSYEISTVVAGTLTKRVDITPSSVDITGDVGIGFSPPRHPLHVYYSETGAIPTDHQIGASTDNKNYLGVHNASDSATYSGLAFETRTSGAARWLIANEWQSSFKGDLVFRTRDGGTSGSEIVRFKNDGNLLVGTTSSINVGSGSAVGVMATNNGGFVAYRDGDTAAFFGRQTSDGEIVNFRKGGATAGTIGTVSGDLFIANGVDVGLYFESTTTDHIAPCNIDGSKRDDAIDLGASSARFDDVFATNGTIQTSDENEKQNIAALTSAEITAAKAISKLFKTFKWKSKVTAKEEKGDTARTHTGVIAQEVQTAMSDAGLDASKYAFWCSDIWWETSTEVAAVEAADAVYEDVFVPAVEEKRGDDGQLLVQAEGEYTEKRLVSEAVEAKDAYTRIDTYHTEEEAPEGATKRTRLGVRYPELLAFIGAATEQRLADIESRIAALESAQ